jgi:hypothetical protein
MHHRNSALSPTGSVLVGDFISDACSRGDLVGTGFNPSRPSGPQHDSEVAPMGQSFRKPD